MEDISTFDLQILTYRAIMTNELLYLLNKINLSIVIVCLMNYVSILLRNTKKNYVSYYQSPLSKK